MNDLYKLIHESDSRIKGDEAKQLLTELGELIAEKIYDDGEDITNYRKEIIMSMADGKHQLGLEYVKR